MTYSEYIRSDAWRHSPARLSELQAAGYRCRLCNADGTQESPLHVHHRTYERFGNELPSDLTALCKECHYMATSWQRARRYAAIIPIRTDISLSDTRQALVDPTREETKS